MMRVTKCIHCGGASTFGTDECVACQLEMELEELGELDND